jgi:hypothetical protein
VTDAVPPAGFEPLALERVEVGDARLEATVRVCDPGFMRTAAAEGVAARAVSLMPGLSRHRCESGSPHGIALELMALSGSPRNLRGETSWDFKADGCGIFHVSIEFDDDLVALGALSAGLRIVNELLITPEPEDAQGGGPGHPSRYVDPLAEAATLREFRRR